MTDDPRLEAITGRTARLADLLDVLWQAATTSRLRESAIAVAADYALETHDQLQRVVEGRGAST